MSDDEVIWISDSIGINLKIRVSNHSINALKKFIEVLELNLPEKEV